MKSKSQLFTIIKKEFTRFFSDRTMVFTTVIMPGLIIYLFYSLMGNNIEKSFTVESTEPTAVYVENMPNSVSTLFDSLYAEIQTEGFDADDIMSQLTNKESNMVYLQFPENFDSLTTAYVPASGEKAPNVQIFYNSTNDGSMATYNMLCTIFNNYESRISNLFDINNDETTTYDQADDEQMLADILSQLIPMLLLMLLFSGCMTVAPNSIAGEKERGTIATLLVTPLKRMQLAWGKIISLSVFAMLSGISSFLGVILSLPKMLQADATGMDINIYSASDYVMLLLILLSTVLVLITIISILSAMAKDVKQAGTMNLPISLTMIIVGMLPMLLGGTPDHAVLYLIPFFNSVMSMTNIMSLEFQTLPIVLTLCSNIVYAVLGALLLTRLFNSEKVMFSA